MMNYTSAITEIPMGLSGRLWRSPMPFATFDPLNQVWPAYQANDINVVVILTENKNISCMPNKISLPFMNR